MEQVDDLFGINKDILEIVVTSFGAARATITLRFFRNVFAENVNKGKLVSLHSGS